MALWGSVARSGVSPIESTEYDLPRRPSTAILGSQPNLPTSRLIARSAALLLWVLEGWWAVEQSPPSIQRSDPRHALDHQA
jgi:hypothetical protein